MQNFGNYSLLRVNSTACADCERLLLPCCSGRAQQACPSSACKAGQMLLWLARFTTPCSTALEGPPLKKALMSHRTAERLCHRSP